MRARTAGHGQLLEQPEETAKPSRTAGCARAMSRDGMTGAPVCGQSFEGHGHAGGFNVFTREVEDCLAQHSWWPRPP